MCQITKLFPCSFPFAPLVPYTQAGWAQHGVRSVLGHSWVIQAMLYPLSSQWMLPLTSMSWVTLVDEWSFCSIWHDIDNPGKQQTCWKLCGDIEPWEKSGWSFILLHLAWLTLITAFLSFCLMRNLWFFHPYQALQTHLPILYFLYAAPGKSWAHTY